MSYRAVVTGINIYKNYPQATLHGCVNDTTDMVHILTTYCHFQGVNKDITLLTDANATKANIMSALKTAVTDAKAGKVNYIVFSMSSHGTQLPDISGDEPDRMDEAFCPHDLAQKGAQWDPNHLIVDDELHDLFIKLPSSVLLEVYLDTCHSGTGLKAIDMLLDRKPKFLMPSVEAFHKSEMGWVRGLTMLREQAVAKSGEKNLPNQILWAACRDNQTSADAYINGTWHGAFTYYFRKEMDACKNKLSRAEVLVKVQNDLRTAGYSQTPQLECPAVDKHALMMVKEMEAALV